MNETGRHTPIQEGSVRAVGFTEWRERRRTAASVQALTILSERLMDFSVTIQHLASRIQVGTGIGTRINLPGTVEEEDVERSDGMQSVIGACTTFGFSRVASQLTRRPFPVSLVAPFCFSLLVVKT
jgi:hypothetical protein